MEDVAILLSVTVRSGKIDHVIQATEGQYSLHQIKVGSKNP